MKMTAPDLLRLKIVDRIVDEPAGGAHQDIVATARAIDAALHEALTSLLRLTPEELAQSRYERFRHLGAFVA
jgi:acetyl-CoA carboxylase carboxyl transferase subunit alpha